jgi:uncharacterized membrane protein
VGRSSHPHRFLTDDERTKIAAAIHLAEGKSSGEIRVHLDKRCKGDPHEAAKKTFEKLGMHATAEKSGVLVWLAVRDRAFAILGDSGIDAKVEPGFWDGVRDRMAKAFSEDRFGDGIAGAIGEIGERLAAAFPHRAGDRNELPDEISEAKG